MSPLFSVNGHHNALKRLDKQLKLCEEIKIETISSLNSSSWIDGVRHNIQTLDGIKNNQRKVVVDYAYLLVKKSERYDDDSQAVLSSMQMRTKYFIMKMNYFTKKAKQVEKRFRKIIDMNFSLNLAIAVGNEVSSWSSNSGKSKSQTTNSSTSSSTYMPSSLSSLSSSSSSSPELVSSPTPSRQSTPECC